MRANMWRTGIITVIGLLVGILGLFVHGCLRIYFFALAVAFLFQLMKSKKNQFVMILPIIISLIIIVRYFVYGGSHLLYAISMILLVLGEILTFIMKKCDKKLFIIMTVLWCLIYWIENAVMYIGWYFQWSYGEKWLLGRGGFVFLIGLCLAVFAINSYIVEVSSMEFVQSNSSIVCSKF